MSMTDEIERIITLALDEDLGTAGDITSDAIFGDAHIARAVIKSKEAGILSGASLLAPLFGRIDQSLNIQLLHNDGAKLAAGSEICALEGPIKSILAGERIALNFLQHLSGIASQTAQLVSLIAHTSARLLDTRKTTPLLRIFEKKAVSDGGGFNHRFGLYDMVLIKDTHVKAAGGVAHAVRKATSAYADTPGIKIEVEVQTEEQFREAVAESPDRIMLDNMKADAMARCAAYIREQNLAIETEASGNITEASIKDVAETGVDFISSGTITHSVKALDIHLVIL